MTTIEAELTRLFSDPKRATTTFRPPMMNELALSLSIPPTTFRTLFHEFQRECGCDDWFKLKAGIYVAFLSHLRERGLVRD